MLMLFFSSFVSPGGVAVRAQHPHPWQTAAQVQPRFRLSLPKMTKARQRLQSERIATSFQKESNERQRALQDVNFAFGLTSE